MYRLLTFFGILLTTIIISQGQDTLNESFLKERLANVLALDDYGCMYKAINGGKVKFKYYPLKKGGYYFDKIDFYKVIIDTSDYIECPKSLLPYCNNYIIAVAYDNNIYRLKGFNENDFNSFFLELQQIAGTLNLKIKTLINDYYVDGLDFECLYKATKEKSKFKNTPDIGKITYKYRDCLRPCKSMIIVQ